MYFVCQNAHAWLQNGALADAKSWKTHVTKSAADD